MPTNKTRIRTEGLNGLVCVVIESGSLRCGILPELGGKMCMLTNKLTGREWLLNEERACKPARYGGNFEEFDRSGFDECFPAIATGEYPAEPWKGTIIPDHGELWTIPWKWNETSNGISMQAHGVRLPYVFTKNISVLDNRVMITYSVENPTHFAMPCFWSAHPLLHVREGMRVVIPAHSQAIIDFSKAERLGGYLARIVWPKTIDNCGREVDLSVLGSSDAGTADKIYACHLSEGYAALHEPDTGEYLGFAFDVREIPHLGVWLNQGGWPFSGKPDYNVAIEPCTGYPDKLGSGEHVVAPPNGRLGWRLLLVTGIADDENDLRDKLRCTEINDCAHR